MRKEGAGVGKEEEEGGGGRGWYGKGRRGGYRLHSAGTNTHATRLRKTAELRHCSCGKVYNNCKITDSDS